MSNFFIPRDMTNKNVGKGFQMTFENGNTISVMFGTGNYCDNKNGINDQTEGTKSGTAEIAIWNKEGVWYNFGNDEVIGYASTDETAKWVQFASQNTF